MTERDPAVDRFVRDLFTPDPYARWRIALACMFCGKVVVRDMRAPNVASGDGQFWVDAKCYGCGKPFRVSWDVVSEYAVPWRAQIFSDMGFRMPDPGPPAASPMTRPTAEQLAVGRGWFYARQAWENALDVWRRTIPRLEAAPEWDYARWSNV